MRTGLALVAMTTLLATAAAGKGDGNESPDKVLAGRTPGKPVQCISQTQIVDTRTFDDGSIYYRMAGKSDYLNRPQQCAELRSDRAYATQAPSTQLCAGDILSIFDATSHIPYGSCTFDSFVPYAKLHRSR